MNTNQNNNNKKKRIIPVKQDKFRQEDNHTCSSTLVGSSITYPLSVRQQHIATAETSDEGEKETQMKKKLFTKKQKLAEYQRSTIPARCLRGIAASKRAAHAAFMAQGRS